MVDISITTFSEEVDSGTISGGKNIDLSLANTFNYTVTGDVDFSVVNPSTSPQGNSFTLILEIDSGGYTVTWPSGTVWPKSVGGTIDSGSAGDMYVFNFVSPDGGSTWIGFIVGEEVK